MVIQVGFRAWATYTMNNNLGEHSAYSYTYKNLPNDDFDFQYMDVKELSTTRVSLSSPDKLLLILLVIITISQRYLDLLITF